MYEFFIDFFILRPLPQKFLIFPSNLVDLVLILLVFDVLGSCSASVCNLEVEINLLTPGLKVEIYSADCEHEILC